ncbi:hypothetical protein LSH36_2157g00005 [Paralvinella palmiformis]|uniref:Uncharacterized protein n=1 Tax=Paralvinella palmiformis TaxID=53620 RepID=A0AAD9IQF0_9ANNE|nr:hypothetical protein LSH36_2157g00005 [Paralvinella palmiformis]
MPGQYYFQASWLDKPEFKGWLENVPGCRSSAHCLVCHKVFSMKNLGVSAVSVHGKGQTHFKAVRSTGSTLLGIGDYFRNGAATSAPRPAAPAAAQPVPAPAVSSRPGCGGKQTLIAEVRYLTSQFIGYAAATDLLEHFNASTSDLRRNGLLQVSRNGPSVNWSFYDKLEKEIKNECDMGLLNIGSCGLHVIHGVFHTGARETDLGHDGLLSSPYYLFKDTSAR